MKLGIYGKWQCTCIGPKFCDTVCRWSCPFFKDWILFLITPSLVYEPKYPKTNSISLAYLAEKVITTLGILIIHFHIFHEYLAPKLSQVNVVPLFDSFTSLILPVTAAMLLSFYLAFELLCGVAAELTQMADRTFYEDWWNATTFAEFNRKWNVPVHEFLLRHVYLEQLTVHKIPKYVALMNTFVFSMLLHELVMTAALGVFFPIMSVLAATQLPMKWVMTKFFKGRPVGNILVLTGLLSGFTIITIGCATVYCPTPEVCEV